VSGVPDQNAGSSFVQCYQQTVSLSTPGQLDTWEGEIYFYTDPSCFGCCNVRDTDNTDSAVRLFPNLNLAAGGTTVEDAWTTLLNNAERWRCAYYGVTVQLDAPALANQGTFVAAQYCVKPMFWGNMQHAHQNGQSYQYRKLVRYDANDTAEYDTCMQMPGAFTGPAKGGCYMPLKLDSNHAEWHDQNDLVFDASRWGAAAEYIEEPITNLTTNGLYPGLVSPYWTSGTWTLGGDLHLLPCTSGVGCVCFRGVSKDATIRLTFRVGFELCVQPGSLLAPNLHATPAYDRTAIDTYFAIAREMKDAYPAEYNDFGKLWDVIKSIASRVAPVVKALPFGEHIVNVGRAVGAVGDAIARRKVKKAKPPPRKEPKAPKRR
jgi:hypothetical protein